MSAAAQLLRYRAEGDLFRGESFPAISAAGEHGAIMHYRVTPETDRAILPDEVYLIDSGGQYLDGTTDITRTVWTGPGLPTAELRERFTRVLKGHIAIATLVFPEGVAGVRLDAFARAALWQAGWISTMAPATASAATCRCMRAPPRSRRICAPRRWPRG